MNLRTILAVVLAGTAGTLANTLALVILIGPNLWHQALVPGRYGVAIALMIAVPFLYRWLPGFWGAVVALVFLTVAPSLNANLVLHMGVPWASLLAFNFVYALAALVVYRLVRGSEA